MAPPVLWTPPDDARDSTRLGQFLTLCEQRTGLAFDDYQALWRWSIDDGLEDCWAAIWDFFDIMASRPYSESCPDR